MYDPFTLDYASWVFNMFNIPLSMMPRIVDSAGDHFGSTKPGTLLLNIQETIAKNVDNVVQFILGEVHGQIECIVPDLFKLVLVLEVLLCDLQVPIDGLAVFTLLLPDLSTYPITFLKSSLSFYSLH